MNRAVERLTKAEAGDGITYRIASRTNPHETYLVSLLDFGGNGSCQCTDFCTRRAPLLSRMVKPEEAIEMKRIKIKAGGDARDALRCFHIVEARRQFCDDLLKAIAEKGE